MAYAQKQDASAEFDTLALGISVMAGAGGLSMETAAREYTDREQVLDTGFTLDTEYTLKLANPSEDISTRQPTIYHRFLRPGQPA